MRKRVNYTLDEKLIEELHQLSSESLIPLSRLVEKAIKEFLKEYEEVNKALVNLPNKEDK